MPHRAQQLHVAAVVNLTAVAANLTAAAAAAVVVDMPAAANTSNP
jgi:hypothetical protein